jgi:hypothetical protein
MSLVHKGHQEIGLCFVRGFLSRLPSNTQAWSSSQDIFHEKLVYREPIMVRRRKHVTN